MNQQDFLNVLGEIPQKAFLDTKVIGEEDCGKYIRQKIEFYCEKDDIISAFVLVPKNITGKIPAIYCHHQHDGDRTIGKREVVGLDGDKDQAIGHELAERGYLVLAPDAIAFEERQNIMGGAGGHYFELAQRLVRGENLLSKILFDMSVGIDYLCSRDDVDKHNIGFIGHSYGGRMAIFGPAYDKRIKVSVSNCGCVNYKTSIDINKDTGIQHDFCVPNILNYGDVEDVIKLANSTNMLISGTTGDKYSLGIEDIISYCNDSFQSTELKVDIYNGEHIFTKEMRDNAYSFLDKYLR